MSAFFVDPTTPTVEYLDKMAILHPELAVEYTNISHLFSVKHWHQLTVAILSFLSSSSKGNAGHYVELYEKVVLACDAKINPQSLAMMASKVADRLVHENDDDVNNVVAACALFETLLETKKERLGAGATSYARSKLVLLKLRRVQQLGADVPESHALLRDIATSLEECGTVLHETGGGGQGDPSSSSSVLHSAYYEASKAYRKLVGPPESFFREALLFLNYTSLDSLEQQERVTLATDISLAALTGEGVFNFGEVVHMHDHPILTDLENTEHAWLLGLMRSMARGDVADFQRISATHAADIQRHAVLVDKAATVQEKITLLALVNMVFERPSSERTLKFEEVADRIAVPTDRVEWVVMRALSLHLIEGSMDQVNGTVSVTWVMPRVLDTQQLSGLSKRFGEWAAQVAQEKDYMMQETIFA